MQRNRFVFGPRHVVAENSNNNKHQQGVMVQSGSVQ